MFGELFKFKVALIDSAVTSVKLLTCAKYETETP